MATTNLSQAIRHARKELGLTQARLSSLSGVQRRQISRLESGGNVTLKTVAKVLAHLPNLQTFIFETVAVEVKPTRSEPWNQGARAAAEFIARACQHVIDRVSESDGPACDPAQLT